MYQDVVLGEYHNIEEERRIRREWNNRARAESRPGVLKMDTARLPGIRQARLDYRVLLTTVIATLRRRVLPVLLSRPHLAYLKVLEVGGGTGILTSVVLNMFATEYSSIRVEYVSTDIASAMQRHALARLDLYERISHRKAPIRFLLTPGHRLIRKRYLREGWADVTLLVRVALHYLEFWDLGLEQAFDATASGGCVVIFESMREDNPDYAQTQSEFSEIRSAAAYHAKVEEIAGMSGRTITCIFEEVVCFFIEKRRMLVFWIHPS